MLVGKLGAMVNRHTSPPTSASGAITVIMQSLMHPSTTHHRPMHTAVAVTQVFLRDLGPRIVKDGGRAGTEPDQLHRFEINYVQGAQGAARMRFFLYSYCSCSPLRHSQFPILHLNLKLTDTASSSQDEVDSDSACRRPPDRGGGPEAHHARKRPQRLV